MGEKTEKATPKKLRDARKKGQVAKSQDFPSAFTFIVSISSILYMSGNLYNKLTTYLITLFHQIPNSTHVAQGAGSFLQAAIFTIFSSSIPIMVFVSLIGLLVNFLIVGPLFSVQAMKPDIKRMNPVTNIKNLFKLKTFIELLKSIFKITGAFILIYSVVRSSLPEIISTCGLPLIASTMVFSSFLIKVVLRVGIFFIVIGIFDLVFQKKNFAKEMKMEKFEVKQEYKDSEGDPQQKSKRKQIAQEMAYQDGPGAARQAKAVITNPTHIAIAIDYKPEEEEPAPKILTMGLDFMAEKIIKVAVANNIPIMRNIELAQTLYYKSEIGEYVPEETYETIAEILKWLAKLDKEKEEEEKLDIFNPD